MGVRSTILTKLPLELRKELEKRLIDYGFSRYHELTEWLRERGYRISKGALNRYGIQFEQSYLVEQAAKQQAHELADAASGNDSIATEALISLVQERLFRILLETEKPAAAVDLARLASIINNLSRTTIAHRRWIAESQARLAKLQRAAINKVSTMEGSGGLSSATSQYMRDLLLSIDPFIAPAPSPELPPTGDH